MYITVDSRKFGHPNYLVPLRALIVIYFKVWQASQNFQVKTPYFRHALVYLMRCDSDV